MLLNSSLPIFDSPEALTRGSVSLAVEKKALRRRLVHLGVISPRSLVILTRASPTLVLCYHLILPLVPLHSHHRPDLHLGELLGQCLQYHVRSVAGTGNQTVNGTEVDVGVLIGQV